MLERNEFLFINSDFMLGNICFSCSSSLFFLWKQNLKIIYLQELTSDFSVNTTLDFVLFYKKIINTLSPEFSPNLLFHIEYPLTTNPIMYMINEISHLWRLKISSSCWAPVTKSLSFNGCGNLESKLYWWRPGTWASAYRKDHEGFEIERGYSNDCIWHQALHRHWLTKSEQ